MIWQNIQYDLLEILGEGGQGTVFKALRRDRATGLCDTVALKILHSKTAVDLWKREFSSLRNVRSPHCVQVLAFDRVKGRPALVLEFVDGLSLLDLGRSRVLTDADIDEIMAQLEVALDDLRSFGSFHGDLSPANVLVDRTGLVKVLDFGLANLGGTNARLTPDFAAPERLSGKNPDHQSDLYSLGCIEMFLRGHLHPISRRYMCEDPAVRKSSGRSSHDLARRELGFRVVRRAEQRRWLLKGGTRTQGHNSPPVKANRWLAAVMSALLLSTTSAASTHVKPPHWASLLIRTVRWHQIFMNGRPMGYSPVTISVPPGSDIEIAWNSAAGHGRKALRAKAGQRIVMEDRDFAP